MLPPSALLRPTPPEAPAPTATAPLLALLLLAALTYGAVMGTFAGRAQQVLYSAAKVPLLLLGTLALCLPSFCVVNSLFGLRRDLPEALRAILVSQGALALTLASLAPYTALCYASTAHYPTALLFNALMFALASLVAQVRLHALYRPLLTRSPRHRHLLRIWLATYAAVGIQMGWVLRPFVGAPDAPVRFLRPEAWGNAYLVVLKLIGDVLGR